MQILIALAAGLIGIFVGGVINALADDLPARETPRLPHYPDGTPRPPSAWLGLSAFLTGQRESTGTPPADSGAPSQDVTPSPAPARLSWRHPITEIVNAIGFIVLAVGYDHEPQVWAWFIYVAILLLITVIDIEHRLILHIVIFPSALFAVFVAAVSPMDGISFQGYITGGLLGFGFFFLLYLGGELYVAIRGLNVVAFGFGDVTLAMLSGLMLGWQAFLLASVMTILAGAAGSLLYMLGGIIIDRRARWYKPLPYGPYIVFGTLAMLLAREEVQEFLRGSYT
jgi:leader peptidase (prepilin peptidase)/N-methyltransferase